MDSYFADVKTIVPPNIYKRFEKDHILKKTIGKETIENGDNYTRNNGFILTKLNQNKEEQKALQIMIHNSNENVSNNCSILLNAAVSPRKPSIQ